MFEPLIQQCVARPTYTLLERAYADYRTDHAPCKDPTISNQCAVRMSVALGRCGFGMESFTPRNRIHHGRHGCRLDIWHVVGAEELARYLSTALGQPERYHGATMADAGTRAAGRHGIIYFNNCFARKGHHERTGDHIDLWTGSQYYNQVLGISAGGDHHAASSLFHRADQVWFFAL